MTYMTMALLALCLLFLLIDGCSTLLGDWVDRNALRRFDGAEAAQTTDAAAAA